MTLSKDLALWVCSCSCTCGNKWTHSYVTHKFGGTPTPEEALKGKVVGILERQLIFDHCFRCAVLGLGIGWQTGAFSPPAAKAEAKPQVKKPDLSSLFSDEE